MSDELDEILKNSYNDEDTSTNEMESIPDDKKNIQEDDSNDGLTFINNVSVYDSEIRDEQKTDDKNKSKNTDIEKILSKDNKDAELLDALMSDDQDKAAELLNEVIENQEDKDDDISETISYNPEKNLSFVKKNSSYLIAGFLSILILAITISIFILKRNIDINSGTQSIQILKPENASNNSNFIFINKYLPVSNQLIGIKKILLDRQATVIYFNEDIDISKFNVSLIDGENIYSPDISFIDKVNVNTLRFSGLDSDSKNFTLLVENIYDGQSNDISFTLKNSSFNPPAIYFNDKKNIIVPSAGYSATLDKAIFSSSGSVLFFNFKDSENILYLKEDDNLSYTIELRENGVNVLRQRENPIQFIYENEGVLIGRMDFEPLRNLNSKIYIKFNNIFRKHNVNLNIDTEKLFLNTSENAQTYTFGNYDVVLERMGKQGNKIALVMHTEDNSLFGKSSLDNSRYANRVETIPDMAVILETPDGKQIEVLGKVHSANVGTDVIFESDDISKFAGNSQITLKINSLSFKKESLDIEIDLKDYESKEEDSIYIENADDNNILTSALIGDKLFAVTINDWQTGKDGEIILNTNQIVTDIPLKG